MRRVRGSFFVGQILASLLPVVGHNKTMDSASLAFGGAGGSCDLGQSLPENVRGGVHDYYQSPCIPWFLGCFSQLFKHSSFTR